MYNLTCESVVNECLLEDRGSEHSDSLLWEDGVCNDWDLFKSLCLVRLEDLPLVPLGLLGGWSIGTSSYVYTNYINDGKKLIIEFSHF